jgi:hypothetical protein
MKNQSWKKKRTFIVSPHASSIKERIERFWGVNIFTDKNLVAIDSGLEAAIPALGEQLPSRPV